MIENQYKKPKAQVFLAFLLVSVLVSWLCYNLMALVSLTIGFAINRVVLTAKEIAIDLIKLFW